MPFTYLITGELSLSLSSAALAGSLSPPPRRSLHISIRTPKLTQRSSPTAGASRSLGLGYAKELLASSPDVRVVAAARNPSSAEGLQALANDAANKDRVYLLQLDVEDKEQVAKAAKELEDSGFLGESGLDALVNNAGVAADAKFKPSELCVHPLLLLVRRRGFEGGEAVGELTLYLCREPEHVLSNIGVNLLGVLNVTKQFLGLLKQGKGKQIFMLSSVCGSIEEFGKNTMVTGCASHSCLSAAPLASRRLLRLADCISKAALNMFSAKLASELGPVRLGRFSSSTGRSPRCPRRRR